MPSVAEVPHKLSLLYFLRQVVERRKSLDAWGDGATGRLYVLRLTWDFLGSLGLGASQEPDTSTVEEDQSAEHHVEAVPLETAPAEQRVVHREEHEGRSHEVEDEDARHHAGKVVHTLGWSQWRGRAATRLDPSRWQEQGTEVTPTQTSDRLCKCAKEECEIVSTRDAVLSWNSGQSN